MATRPGALVPTAAAKPQPSRRVALPQKTNLRRAGPLSVVRFITSDDPTDNDRKVANYPNLVHHLLERAASRRERGETFCMHCKGEGVVPCQTCQGAGVVEPEKVKVNMMKHAGYVIKNAVGQMRGEPPGKGFNMKITNRCRACHGTGTTECMYCHGEGRFK